MVLGIGQGSMEIQFATPTFTPGQPIRGKAILKLNNSIEARGLRVEFYGEVRSGRRSGVRQVHKVTKMASGQRTYRSGEAIDFEITPPADCMPKTPEGVVGALVGLFSPKPHAWLVAVSLDVPMKMDVFRIVQVFPQQAAY